MSITTLSSREFNQDTGRAKKAAQNGPVIITDRGRPTHVLLSMADYLALTKCTTTIADLLAMPADQDFDFDPPRLDDMDFKPADFS